MQAGSLTTLKTKTVWCVPFSGAVGLFNKLQTQKKEKKKIWTLESEEESSGYCSLPADVRRGKETMYVNVRKAVAEGSVRNQPGTYG